MAAGQVFALFGGRCIADEGQKVGLYAGIVEQGVSLGGGAIGGDGAPGPFALDQIDEQVILDAVSAGLERLIDGQAPESCRFFRLEDRGNGGTGRPGVGGMDAIDAEAAAMGRELFDIPEAQSLGGEHALHRVEREVGEVLVIDGVELGLFDQPQQVREFQGEGAAGLEGGLKAGGEVVDVRDVGIDVVADDEIPLTALGGQALAQVGAKEFSQDGDALGLGRGGGAGGGFDAETGDAGGDEIAQQVAVVGGHLDDQAVSAEGQAVADHVGVAGGVVQPTGGGGGEVGVVVAKQFVGAGVVGGLDQPAVVADEEFERVIGLRTVQVRFRQVGVGRGCEAQVQEDVAEGGVAVAAVHWLR